MATQDGVTQAVFPEGGLSLDCCLAAPRLGLINYMISEWAAGRRDVVFVPVSINYDRVLGGYILNAAGHPENWRFEANISIISKFLIIQFWLWLWLWGRYIRFGFAAASFGAPVSLAAFHQKEARLTKYFCAIGDGSDCEGGSGFVSACNCSPLGGAGSFAGGSSESGFCRYDQAVGTWTYTYVSRGDVSHAAEVEFAILFSGN